MLDIQKRIDVISSLLAHDTVEFLTYAALECRLVIEYLCYDRLLMALDYVSYADLKGWQPNKVIRAVESLANQEVTQKVTIRISAETPRNDGGAPTQADYEKLNFKDLGTQSELNIKKLTSLWNALANKALHVHIPKQKSQQLTIYGNKDEIKQKIEECLLEFSEIAKGNILISGFGKETSINCNACNTLIKRKIDLLHDGQVVSCINPDCKEEYVIEKSEDEILFTQPSSSVKCKKCGEQAQIFNKDLKMVGLEKPHRFSCSACHTPHLIFTELRYCIDSSKNDKDGLSSTTG